MENPVRILIVNGKMICGGVESFIMNIYRHIDRSKIQFDFLLHYKEKFFYDDEIERLGGRIYRLSFRNDKNYLKYKKDLNNFFKNHQEYNVVWGHMDGLASIYLKVAKKNGIKATICHAHITNAEKSLKGLIKKILRKGINKFADYKFACSTEAGKYLYGKESFDLIYNSIDTNKFKFDKEVRQKMRAKYLWQDKFVVGHVGRFNDQKNHFFLINIFKKIKEQNPNSLLCLCGDGENITKVKDYVSELGLSESVFFAGNISNVNEFYQAFDVFVMPSLYEGLPVSGVEAQTSGLKCFFSDTITKETSLINANVKFLSLSNLDLWVNSIIDCFEYNRQDCSNYIKDLGYDIYVQAKKLETVLMCLSND